MEKLTAAAGQVEKRLHLLLSGITDVARLRRRATGGAVFPGKYDLLDRYRGR